MQAYVVEAKTGRALAGRENLHRAAIKLYAKSYNQQRPHSALATKQNWAITPNEFYEAWKKDNQKGGFADGEGLGLSQCTFSGRAEESGPNAAESVRPDDRRTVHVGARVAPQQSSILRVNEASGPPLCCLHYPLMNRQRLFDSSYNQE
ncbi:MAG: hypothetical protein IT447_09020 [Phycisphaerales bacterium]|nr:hypothetical protein [Phycisphaerales bacterium]